MKMHEFQIMEMYKQIGYRDIDCDGKLEPPVTIKLPQCAIDWLKAVEREAQRDSYSVWGLASMENKELIKKLKKEQDELNKKSCGNYSFSSMTKKIVRLLATISLIC